MQRANADGSIPDAAVNEAIAQSKAAGKASQGSPSTDQVWAELGPEQHRRPHPRHRRGSRHQDVVYIATGSGGLWKSTDGGATLAPAWDSPVAAVDGCGRGRLPGRRLGRNRRGRPRRRLGVLRQGHLQVDRRRRDAGPTWACEDGDTIGRIVIDPRDDDRVFVAVQGALHDTAPSRGLFMTEDGGATWTRVIVAGEHLRRARSTSRSTSRIPTSCSRRPGTRSATRSRASTARTRTSTARPTRGHTWANVQNPPLPQSETNPALQTPDNLVGKMGVDFSDSDPNRAYLISSTARGNFNGFFTSTDAGATWTAVGPHVRRHAAEHQRRLRVVVRPRRRRPDRTRCTCSSRVSASPRASTAAPRGRRPRPRTPTSMRSSSTRSPPGKVYLGNDGGFYRSTAERRGARGLWTKTPRLPTTQFYAMDVSVAGRLARQRRVPGQRLIEVVGTATRTTPSTATGPASSAATG